MHSNASTTFPFEARHNIDKLALSPNGALLLAVDVNGKCLLINYHRKVVLHHHSFKGEVSDVKFSPNGKMIAVAVGSHVQLWRCPGFTLDYSPFSLLRELPGHYDTITALSWSPDSEFLLTSSKDMTARLYPILQFKDFPGALLSGHRDEVLGAWFSKDMKSIFSVSKDGALFAWSFDKEMLSVVQEKDIDRSKTRKGEKGQKIFVQTWKSLDKHYFEQNHAKVTSVSFHAETGLLSCGFSSGIFGIWELPDFINIHTLRYSLAVVNI
jgi:periodic tryptophan protein 2